MARLRSALAHNHDATSGWVDATNFSYATAATSPSSSSVLSFDGHDGEYSAAWMDAAHAMEQPHLVKYGPTLPATTTSAFCFSSFVGSGDSGGMATTQSAASGWRHKRSRSPSKGKEPQSQASKKRRERVSERLRALQELVLSGDKVDTVTMLDKAISYVKFLQLQLKVLETDAFWPAQDGSAPEISQVKDALDAILLSSSQQQQQQAHRPN